MFNYLFVENKQFFAYEIQRNRKLILRLMHEPTQIEALIYVFKNIKASLFIYYQHIDEFLMKRKREKKYIFKTKWKRAERENPRF